MIKEVSIVIQPEKEKDENFIQKEIRLALKKQGISFEENYCSGITQSIHNERGRCGV